MVFKVSQVLRSVVCVCLYQFYHCDVEWILNSGVCFFKGEHGLNGPPGLSGPPGPIVSHVKWKWKTYVTLLIISSNERLNSVVEEKLILSKWAGTLIDGICIDSRVVQEVLACQLPFFVGVSRLIYLSLLTGTARSSWTERRLWKQGRESEPITCGSYLTLDSEKQRWWNSEPASDCRVMLGLSV